MANTDLAKDSRWPWCENCQSYHHPRNITCRELWPKEYTLLAGEAWLWMAEGKWNSPRDAQRGHMGSAWVLVGPIHEREMRAAGIDLPKYPGEWQLLEPLEVPWDLRMACMRGMIEAKSHWADGRKKRSGDPGQDWRRVLVDKA